jgi:uncharacterized protein (DUF1697 family)
MAVYIALLRGINVGGHKQVAMEKLRAAVEAIGCTPVQTYIRSGNLVFRARKSPPEAWSKKIEVAIERAFGFPVRVITRTQAEFEELVGSNPFSKEKDADGNAAKLHVSFLAEAPLPAVRKEMEKLTTLPDRMHCGEREIYFHLPNGFAGSSLLHNPLERKLLKAATSRNWRTVNALLDMARGLE